MIRPGKHQPSVELLLLLACVTAATGAPQVPAQQARKQPLPKGAITRIYTALSGHEAAVTAIAFAPDGSMLASASFDEALCLWDPVTGKELRRITGHPKLCSAVFSPDGLMLASAGWDGTVRLWQTASGQPGRVLQASQDRVLSLAFSPDGKTLASAGPDATLALWYVATGNRIRTMTGRVNTNYALAFSPDGKWLGSCSFHDQTVQLWQVQGGQALRRIGNPQTSVNCFAFSPDGKSLVTGGSEGQLVLWETATARVRVRFKSLPITVHCVAFSPDARTIATGHDDGHICVWSAATGKELNEMRGHRERVRALAFAPAGTLLASGSEDMTLLVWNTALLAREEKVQPAPLTPRTLDELWDELAYDDADRAYRAVLALAAAPEQSVPFLQERSRHGDDMHARIARLVAELDSDRFVVRQKATTDLEKVGRLAEVALRGELVRNSSPEVRRRIEVLLSSLPPVEQFVLSGEQARTQRMVEVLERAATPSARQMLESLATGAAQKWLREEAQASLERLLKRTAAKK